MQGELIEQLYCQETGADLEFALPEQGFLKDYIDYAKEYTDAPEHYHLFAGLTIIATALGNKVWFRGYGNRKAYPNMWLILLAPSSFFRKTTCLNIGKSIIYEVDRKLILPTEFSPEALASTLQKAPQGLFIWSEFAGFLSQLERPYMLGTKEFLTDIFDCPEFYERKLKNETITIEKPCISIMAASTIEWLNSKLREGDLRGGFLNRFLYIPATKKNKIIPFPPSPSEFRRQELAKKLSRIGKLEGEADLSGVTCAYEEFYIEHEKSLGRQRNQELLSGFYTRLADYCLKFSVLYQVVSEGNLTVSMDSMQKAIYLTKYLKRTIVNLIDEELALSPDAAERKRLLKLIPEAPEHITRADLTRYSHMSAKQINNHLLTLFESYTVRSSSIGEGREKTKIYYKEAITSQDFTLLHSGAVK